MVTLGLLIVTRGPETYSCMSPWCVKETLRRPEVLILDMIRLYLVNYLEK